VAFRKDQFRLALINWHRRYGRDLPWRRTRDPYAILVSEVMLQQTQVATVIRFYHEWLRRFPDFASLAMASENQVLRSWQGLGYYARARNLHATAKVIMDRHGGKFPRAINQLEQLPGIGKYTARAIASFAFDETVPIVEANTARVLARLFNFRGSIDSHQGQRTLWQNAANLLPKHGIATFNSALLDLGALICVARKPKCDVCPVHQFCRAKNPAALPVRNSRPKLKQLLEKHALIVNRGQILLEQSCRRWRGMWVLPPLGIDCLTPSDSQPWPVYQSVFPFTHHRVTLCVYRCAVPKRITPGQRWFGSIEQVAMPSPHRRALTALLPAAFSMQNEQHESPGNGTQKRDRNPKGAQSWKPISRCSRADSTTIIFATEPTIVRLPANVVARASSFHINATKVGGQALDSRRCKRSRQCRERNTGK
jgi:A/G-specific adenine glycosylase